MAEILNFPKPDTAFCECASFRKALAAIHILMQSEAKEASELIHLWVEHALLSQDEAEALYIFYGWE
jgi:hypothetical protein